MTAEHIPDIVLERYRLNELPSHDATRVAERLRSDAALRGRLARLDDSDTVLREPLERMRSRMAGRETPVRAPMIRWPIPAAVAVCTMLLAVVWQVRSLQTNAVSQEPTERVKGTETSGVPSLTVFRRTAAGSEQLADGTVAHAGDLIRLGYRAAGRSHGVIVSIDGAGAVTMQLPPNGNRAAPLGTDAMVLLDDAYELDDAPRWERFFFVAGDAPFDPALVLDAARSAASAHFDQPPAALALPRALEQAGFTLQKESRP
jgi:hypothetical protein